MQVGQKVISDLYKEYGEGTIISSKQIFDKEFFNVFFENLGKAIEIQKQDLKTVETPIDLLKNNHQSTPTEFKLNYLAHTLESMTTGDQALSPANFKITPLPHQLLALNFVIDQFKPRCLLSDEVGLGKTVEAILIMEELKLRNIVKRILIITPSGLTNQWRDELKIKFSEDFSVFDSISFKSFQQLYGKETNCWKQFNQVITSIDFLKPRKIHEDLSEKEYNRRTEHNNEVFEDCVNAEWDMVIIDEAHKLSKYKTGEETARYKLGKQLSETTPIFLILTATPHRGKPFVFKNLLGLVDPFTFNKIEQVTPNNVKKITVRNKKRACIDFNGNRLFKNRITSLCKIEWEQGTDDPEKQLYDAVVQYISEYYNYAQQEKNTILIFLLMLYQRIVSSSSKAILKSLERRLITIQSLISQAKEIQTGSLDDFFEIPGEKQLEQLEKITPILKNPELVKKEISTVQHCIDLAKNAIIGRNDAKLRKLLEIIDEIKKKENDKHVKFLIFTEFIETQKYIIESLEKLGYSTAYINGTLDLSEKIHQKQKFKDNAQILVSTDSGGEGINLQFCHVIINYDLPWNPMSIEQRIGRVDRIGQDKDVIAINFILADTVEEYVREKIETKLEIVKEQFGEDKLHDILSTLDEEFQFDKIYIDYLTQQQTNDKDLDQISENIYNRTKEILENDDILIPFVEENNLQQIDADNIKTIPNKIRTFTELFLKNQGQTLEPYKDKTDLYYFKNDFRTDKLQSRYSKIVFDQQKGVETEDAELFSLMHPYIKETTHYAKTDGKTSVFLIEKNMFKGTTGYLFNWIFTISNNFNMKRQYIIPTFITEDQQYNRRISEYLKNIEQIDLIKYPEHTQHHNLESCYKEAQNTINTITENLFWETEQKWKQKIKNDQQKMDQYYQQKAQAIAQIKIENIQHSKQIELRKERQQKTINLEKQAQLFPDITCFQIVKILFT